MNLLKPQQQQKLRRGTYLAGLLHGAGSRVPNLQLQRPWSSRTMTDVAGGTPQPNQEEERTKEAAEISTKIKLFAFNSSGKDLIFNASDREWKGQCDGCGPTHCRRSAARLIN